MGDKVERKQGNHQDGDQKKWREGNLARQEPTRLPKIGNLVTWNGGKSVVLTPIKYKILFPGTYFHQFWHLNSYFGTPFYPIFGV
jgi:hypothetical protein